MPGRTAHQAKLVLAPEALAQATSCKFAFRFQNGDVLQQAHPKPMA